MLTIRLSRALKSSGLKAALGLGAFAAAAILASCQTSDHTADVSSAAASRVEDQAAAKIVEPAGDASKARLRVMTSEQYHNTLASIFGPDIRFDARFAPMTRTGGLLENGAAIAGISEAQVEQYQITASVVAAQVTDSTHRGYLIPCTPVDEKSADAVCAGKFLTKVGRLLYRHPLAPDQSAALIKQAGDDADRLQDFYAGLSYALEGMLVSPEMLLISETSEPDPEHPGRQRLDAYSLATRLSLLFWNSGPDSMLLDAAASGGLQTPDGRARMVAMMTASPRFQTGVRAFFDDMFGFDDFQTLSKDAVIYPIFTGVSAVDAREQTLRTVIDLLITQNGDYRDLFTTRKTFVSFACTGTHLRRARGRLDAL